MEAARLEQFETFSREGASLGLVARDAVHRRGLWHRSAQVFLFDPEGRLLLQQRAVDKDLYAGLWDYSVGEHLRPGESFIDGALRGLREELGLSGIELQPLAGMRHVEHSGAGFVDREIQQAYQGVVTARVIPDPVEVAQIRFIALAELRSWIARREGDFTPWFVQDMREFGFI